MTFDQEMAKWIKWMQERNAELVVPLRGPALLLRKRPLSSGTISSVNASERTE